MRRILVAGNWKMNASRAQTDTLITGLRNAGELTCDLAVFPPFPYLSQAISVAEGSQISVGAQNCAEADSGAFTGEVSAEMLSDLGASMVIIGHSERRTLYGETDDVVLRKTRKALDNGLIAVVCVGETLEERQGGKAEEVVGAQMSLLISELTDADWKNVVIAYEPVWAIGTGETATPEQAQAIHAFIRGLLTERSADLAAATRLLYGGSVKAANAAELFSQQDIDGGLVGGASLDVDEFLGICRA
ncbi:MULTISPECIES: triose-phosphate isomerase [Thalassolituus]|uniref:triose-phosphate isomerase n=1 Tax=Thalassolituus TaxID=187492 RepID=UPI000C59803F|nr:MULTISPECIES: triose-phosphate isomerase [Thalassolituus]MAX85496.1 triose-phosphate isomerase [Oceanospirillaceae bacterium]MEC9255797.1 triose-phosphate isomerase [Pseudomonadota bacterium]MED5440267.1 triose-phosphate isomerase [Pseudomonadota bacterium]MEE3209701.1 triose-phosphate isomerase [Pseudomonadota bacterium]